MTFVRVLLADDHALLRAGIRALLQPLPDVTVVAEAADAPAALALIESAAPDVVLMDIAMQGANGLEATQQITRQFPHVRVIILSSHSDAEYVAQAFRAGAVGYIVKDVLPIELELALRAVVHGAKYISPGISGALIDDYLQRLGGENKAADPLTPRQRDVLRLIAQGLGTKQIAQALHISVKTVETHRTLLMDRLGIHDVAGLTRYAIQQGLIPPPK